MSGLFDLTGKVALVTGANTGLGGVIRDPLGTGLGAKPICNTDVFCFAPPDTSPEALPPGVLHPLKVMKGVVAGVRDYGNRMGIPTVNGGVWFHEGYVANPLVYCGTVGLMPHGAATKSVAPGDAIVVLMGDPIDERPLTNLLRAHRVRAPIDVPPAPPPPPPPRTLRGLFRNQRHRAIEPDVEHFLG